MLQKPRFERLKQGWFDSLGMKTGYGLLIMGAVVCIVGILAAMRDPGWREDVWLLVIFISVPLIVTCGVLFLVILLSSSVKKKETRLVDSGILIKGIVTSIEWIRAGHQINYQYSVNGTDYTGDDLGPVAPIDIKSDGTINIHRGLDVLVPKSGDQEETDSVMILYDPANPKVHKPLFALQFFKLVDTEPK